MYHEQKATIEAMAAEWKQSMDKLAERSSALLRQAEDALAVETGLAEEALALEMVKQAKEELQSASAAHAKEVSRLLQQASEATKALTSTDSEGTNVARCICNKCCDSAASPRSFYCTACGEKTLTVSEVREHPTLHGVGVCIDCYSFLLSSPFTKDVADNVEEQCRWCGQGGSILVCDQCDKVFCETCIVRNYGDIHGLGLILKMNDWQCFCCSPELLAVHVHELNAFREAKTREARHVHLQIQRENYAELLLAQERKERQNRDKEIQTNSQNKNSSVKSINQTSSTKRAVTLDNEQTTCQKKPCRSTEVKEHEKQPAPSATPARVYIRPHQWAEKRREARERRERAAAAERLKSGVTDLPNNGPSHQNSNTQAERNNQGEEGLQLLRREGQLDAEQKLPRESASEGKGKETQLINF